MNKKVKVIIATGAVLAVGITLFAFVRKAPKASVKMIPTSETTVIEVKPTESVTDQKTMVSEDPGQIPEITFPEIQLETLAETQETEQKSETKKTTKKTKKIKKTKKTTKKTKKTNKTNKKTTGSKFTYGQSKYTYKNFTVYVNIKKDNTASVTVAHNTSTSDTKSQIFFDFSGKINPNTGLFVYNNGSKESVVKNTHVNQARMDYLLKGSGYMTFNGNTLTWFDSVDHYADSVTFVKQ